MSIESHLSELVRRHQAVEQAILAEEAHPSANELKLLEINTNPAMSVDNSTLEEILPSLIDGTIELVLQTQVPIAHHLLG